MGARQPGQRGPVRCPVVEASLPCQLVFDAGKGWGIPSGWANLGPGTPLHHLTHDPTAPDAEFRGINAYSAARFAALGLEEARHDHGEPPQEPRATAHAEAHPAPAATAPAAPQAAEAAPPAAAPAPAAAATWEYQDPRGEIQGPFTVPEMLEWWVWRVAGVADVRGGGDRVVVVAGSHAASGIPLHARDWSDGGDCGALGLGKRRRSYPAEQATRIP